ncbi:T9SS type A sorting domain-containing protein [Flavihumibacter sp. UBA7668]|uniref:T9SS type A sorting domain-containing protein n=1 Tax=Flavihumibacter sp. UBA7668 TaxID=1946542 RepID=UPI0025C31B80|nr:T9SS type A sorting domain-containing protein [Flavihumibacter sp. UBA7668]
MKFSSPAFLRQWRRTALYVLFAIVAHSTFAQISQYPQNRQLYPRNQKTNKAAIPIAGTIEKSSGYTMLLLKKYRNNQLMYQLPILLFFRNNKASFKLTEEIKAELANYRFELYGVKGLSQTLLQSADQVVAGDAFIIQGQSNAVANLRGNWTPDNDANSAANAPNREFVRVYGSGSSSFSYSKEWFIGDGNVWFENNGNTGQWGMRMGSNLAGSMKIPVAIFNGADPGQPLQFFQRNDGSPESISTNYGRLLSRIKEAGFEKNIQAILWYQGESDVLGALSSTQLTTEQYKQSFLQLYSDWKQDFPGIKQIYLFQIRFGCGMASVNGALEIQEAQRQLDEERKDISIMSTGASIQLFDGGIINYCHFNFPNGYGSFGDWITELVKKDVYGVKNLPTSIYAPAPQKAAFSSVENLVADQLTLTLQDAASSYEALGDLTSEFRLEGGSFTITSVVINDNKVIIDFSRNPGTNNNPTGLSFIAHDNNSAPMLINNRGIGLLYFYNLPIGPLEGSTSAVCKDQYERLSLLGTQLKMKSKIKALISSPLDNDRFYFHAKNNKKGLKLELTNLPADYDVYLYDSRGKLIESSTKDGQTDETIVLDETKKKERYTIYISGKKGAFDANSCYTLKLNYKKENDDEDDDEDDDNNSSALIASEMEAGMQIQPIFRIYPNPVQDRVTITWPSQKAGTAEIRVIDLNGRQVKGQRLAVQNGTNLLQMQVGGLTPGVYLLQIQQDGQMVTRKLTITNR